MDMSSATLENARINRGTIRRSRSREDRSKKINDDLKTLSHEKSRCSPLPTNGETSNRRYSRHSTSSSPEVTAIQSPSPADEEIRCGRRSSLHASSASPAPPNGHNNGSTQHRRNSNGLADSITSGNCNNNNNQSNGHSSLLLSLFSSSTIFFFSWSHPTDKKRRGQCQLWETKFFILSWSSTHDSQW